jgi:hypothetical protein
MIYQEPSTDFDAWLTGAPTGQVGTLTVRIEDADSGDVVVADSDAGITEPRPGKYKKTLTAPDVKADYFIVWTLGSVESSEELLVTSDVTLVAIEGSYATRTDLDAYLEDGLPEGYTNAQLDRVLIKASEDIDLYASRYKMGDEGLTFASDTNPIIWRTWFTSIRGQLGIVYATCAQAEYRLARGDQFFVEPDGEGPRIGGKAKEELRRASLILPATTAITR